MNRKQASTRRSSTVTGLRLPLALVVASLCSTSGMAAEVTLPTVSVNAASGEEGYAPETTTAGSKTAVKWLEQPRSVTVINRHRMNEENLHTLGDVMQQVTGVSVTPFDGANPDYQARGYSLEITYDGVPSGNGGSGTQEFDMAIYESIEVLRGPNGVYQGTGQPGGSINFVRKRGSETFAMTAGASAGSWNNWRGDIDIGGPISDSGNVRGRAVATWQDRGFYYDKGDEQKWLGYATLDFDLSQQTTLSVGITHQQDDFQSPSMGLPAFSSGEFLRVPRSTHVYPAWNFFSWETREYFAELEHRMENGWIIRAKGLDREQDKFFKDAYPAPQVGVDPESFTTDYTARKNHGITNRTALDLYAAGPLTLWNRVHQVTLGYNREKRDYAGRSATFPVIENVSIFNPDSIIEPDGPYLRGSASVFEQNGYYTQARLSITDPLTLIFGGRLSDMSNKSRNVAPSQETNFSTSTEESEHFTPYVAAIWQTTPDISLYGSFSDIFIPQFMRDQQDRLLKPREGEQYELGIKARLLNEKLNVSFAYFDVRDLNRAMPTLTPNVYTTAGEVRVDGFELELSGSPLAGLNVSVGYTYQDTRYHKHQSMQDEWFSLFEPSESLKVYARYEPASVAGFFIGGGIQARSSIIGTGEKGIREQGGVAIFNAHAGYRLAGDTTLTLSVNNIFDHSWYARTGGLNAYNTYGEPRQFTLGIRTTFQ